MGKPFAKELLNIPSTLKWSLDQEVNDLKEELIHEKKPLLIVGSGGSLSACHYAAALYQQYGMMAKAISPLELYYAKSILRESMVMYISASGRNNDILFGYKTAMECEPVKMISLCMKAESPLGELASASSISRHFSFELPSGGDGFLATNSLVAFFGVLGKALDPVNLTNLPENLTFDHFENSLSEFMQLVSPDYTFSVLHAGWGQPVAIDIESKLAEAALGDVLVADYRNFGHGRHHWFDKRGENACIIAIITPAEEEIAEKTFALLPKSIPILRITTALSGPAGSIELLIKSFLLVKALGGLQHIDPGRPGVPNYGSDLYHLNFRRIYRSELNKASVLRQTAIIRKSGVSLFQELSHDEKKYWETAYEKFVKKLQKATYGTLIFDYDGTICSAKNRWSGVDPELTGYLLNILEKGFLLGIATGRGKSVRDDLHKFIPEHLRKNVIIGYYNGNEIGTLDNIQVPDKEMAINRSLQLIYDALTRYVYPVPVKFEIKPAQLTVQIKEKSAWKKVRKTIIQLIMLKNLPNIQILESSHSMDIIDQSKSGKLRITEHCQQKAAEKGISTGCLFFGDKGQWPGNDYQLLSEECSLSVDEVSSLDDSCWNLAAPGIKNIQATVYYLSCLNFSDQAINLKLK